MCTWCMTSDKGGMKRYVHCTNHGIYTVVLYPSCYISDSHRKGGEWRWVDGTFFVHSNVWSLVAGIVILYLNCSKNYSVNKSDQNIVGANLSELHLVELLDEMLSVCVYRTLCCKSLAAFLIMRILTSCVNSIMIHKRWRHGPWTANLFDGAVPCIVAWLIVPVSQWGH